MKIVFFLLNNRLYKNIKIAWENEYKSPTELERIQQDKFKKLVKHAHQNVPYYKDILKGISDVRDIQKIRFLTKLDINKNKELLRAENFDEDRFLKDSTSGSTGESLYYYTDKLNFFRNAIPYRDDRRAGYKMGSKALYLWGAERDINKKENFYQYIKDTYLYKIKKLSTYHLNDDDLDEFVRVLNKFKPNVLIAYASPLYRLANYVEKNNIHIKHPDGIITSAETLFLFQREKIEEVFKCKIFNRYGSREFGHVAAECEEHDGLHIHNDRFVLEIVDENGNKCDYGTLGEIVITDLDEYAFPLIRYKTGDLGILSNKNCACGRGLPLLEKIEGRVFDLVKGSNGNYVGGTFWTLLKHKIEGWGKFQVIQKKENTTKIIVEKNPEMRPDFKQELTRIVKDKLGENFYVEIDIVDKIPLTKTGKHRWIISEISPYVKR